MTASRYVVRFPPRTTGMRCWVVRIRGEACSTKRRVWFFLTDYTSISLMKFISYPWFSLFNSIISFWQKTIELRQLTTNIHSKDSNDRRWSFTPNTTGVGSFSKAVCFWGMFLRILCEMWQGYLGNSQVCSDFPLPSSAFLRPGMANHGHG